MIKKGTGNPKLTKEYLEQIIQEALYHPDIKDDFKKTMKYLAQR